MMVKASGRSALIVATGLFVCFAAPLPAMAANGDSAAATSKSDSATAGKSVRHSARYWKRYAQRKSGKVASKSTEPKKTADKDGTDISGSNAPAIPASVANANALLASADADSASAMTAKANTMLLAAADKPAPVEAQGPTDAAVVSSDQLNDVDRALQQNPATQTVAMAVVKPLSAAPVQASNSESSTWDQTSLVGKIFIAFGALLTMASAARMFMA